MNIKQNIVNSNVISASNINRELLTLAYDGSMGLGVTQPQGVLLNIKQNIVNSNVISASNLNREVLTLAYDGSMGLGVTQPQGVLFTATGVGTGNGVAIDMAASAAAAKTIDTLVTTMDDRLYKGGKFLFGGVRDAN